VFQVMFDLQEEPRWQLPVKNLEVIPEVIFSSRTSTFDLTLSVREATDGLDAMFEYDTDLFDESTIQQLAAHYENLLRAVIADPNAALRSLLMLDAGEIAQLTTDWSGTAPDTVQTLWHLFDKAASKNAESVAVSQADNAISYRDLQQQAASIAGCLSDKDIGSGDVVGIVAERRPETFAAMLGVLQAGAAWMPLDPAYPDERLQAMLSVASPALVLTHDVSGQFAAFPVCLIADASKADALSREVEVDSAATACVLFTSGSTGEPKAVQLTHAGLANYVSELAKETRVKPGDKLLQFASLNFDISIEETFTAFTTGATLVLRTPGPAPSAAELLALVEADAINWMSLPTAYWHELVQACSTGTTGLPGSLQTVIIGGEKAQLELWQRWREIAGSRIRLLNTYGPTETSIAATWFDLTHQNPASYFSIPIGRPVPGVRAYVLNEQAQPLPVGVPGELFIGGVGVAAGYLNDAARSAEKFVNDPFSGGTMYRSGDRVRWLSNGNLEYLGRNDKQVKLRGHRVEPAEIESVLLGHPAVDACAVAVAMRGDEPVLVAYAAGQSDDDSMRRYLLDRLPDYMVPDVFVSVAAIPLTVNGKIDYAALPEPDLALLATADYREPETAQQRVIAGIWQEVLGAQRVGLDDDFFELGGHSLLATRVVARIRDALGQEVSLRLLFNNPTVYALCAAMSGGQGRAVVAAIKPRKDTELPPLSFSQQRLWFLDQLEPGSATFNLPWMARIRGALNSQALQRSINALVARHEILRTRFFANDGDPLQVILPSLSIAIENVDCSGADEPELQERLRELTAQGFDLQSGPLLRVHLLRVGPEDHVLLLLMHHIVSDGWSMGVIYRELSALYQHFITGGGEAPAGLLPELPVQYADYAIWQQRWLESQSATDQLMFWREQLSDAPPLLDLYADYERPQVQSYRGAWLDYELPATLSAGLQRLAADQNCSFFMVMLAAFKLLVARYAGSEDIVIGTPVAGRQRTELEGLVGFFLNTLVLRSDLSGNPTFAELLQRVRQTALQAYDHQDMPFEQLVNELQPERNPAYSPIVQVMFNLHNEPHGKAKFDDLDVAAFSLESGTSKFDLNVAVHERDAGLLLGMEYSSDLFAPETIERMLREYADILSAITEDAVCRLSELPLPGLQAGRIDAPEYPQAGRSLAGRVAQAIRDNAQRLACDDGQRAVRFDQLALDLPLQPAVAAKPVALLLGHDATMLQGLVSVILQQRPWVALDPWQPAARMQEIIADAGADELVHAAAFSDIAAGLNVGTTIVIDDCAPATVPDVSSSSDSLAYLLYTSGTTGKPKGVQQTGHKLQAHIDTYAKSVEIHSGDRLSLFSSYAYDAALMDIFAALFSGACLCPVDMRSESAPLDALLAREITLWHSTPSVLRLLLQQPRSLPGNLRALVLGGEEACLQDFSLFKECFSDAAVFVNGLGPSESTTALQWHADKQSHIRSGALPVGQPVDGVAAYLVGANGEPSAFCGELVICSQHLAVGYHNKPAETQAAFSDGCYRTGDHLKYTPDGNFIFTGRGDGQLKLRGLRIEPGEIEAVLSSIGGVGTSVVRLLDSDSSDSAKLCAWYEGDASITPHQLRTQLRHSLPEAMVPSAFVAVDELPLTANGKIDVSALPVPATELAQHYREPVTALQRDICAIWEDLLERSQIGLDDDFFALGGHSLIATRMIARLRDRLGVAVSLRELFSHPVLEDFAACLRPGNAVDEIPLEPHSDAERYIAPLSWSQQRLWFLDQLEPGNPAYSLHRAMRIKGSVDVLRLQSAVDALIARHESLRTVFASRHAEPVQLLMPDMPVELSEEWLSGAGDEQLRAQLLELIRQPFDLQRGPLLRINLLRVTEADAVLLLSMHHIVSDGWSVGVLCDELSRLYAGEALPPLAVQYADYALWQQDWLKSAAPGLQLEYWRKQLHEVPPVLQLLYDYPRPVVPSFRGAWRQLRLSPELTASLNDLATRSGSTLYMVLLAVFNLLLSRYSGRDDIVVGSPVAGRQHSELENLIGFFLNTLVLRTDLSGNPGFNELLERTRDTALGAYDNQALPFEKLLEELQPARSLSTTPLVQVMFNLHNEFDRPLTLGDESYTFHLDRGTAKFDLNVAVAEGASGLLVAMEYNSDLFKPETIDAMLEDYQSLLSSVVAEPAARLRDLPFGTGDRLGNNAKSLIPEAGRLEAETVVEAFATQVRENPQRPVVETAQHCWTYGELDQRSNAVAQELLATEGQVVGLLLGHDAPMLAGLLGALKAGKTYVPLDPDAPVERLQTIAAEAGVAAIVCGETWHDQAVVLAKGLPVFVAGNTAQAGTPAVNIDPAGLAYILFTSGTTGKPKGVMQTHRNLLHHAQGYQQALGINRNDRLSLLSPFGFDAAVMDIYAALISGACLCPFDLKNEAYLGEVIEKIAASNITLLHSTPTVYRYLMRHKICRHDVTQVRAVVLGGEEAKAGDFDFFKKNFDEKAVFVNGLGPSECTLALQWFATQDTELSGGVVPVGYPVAGVECILLDCNSEEPVIAAVTGEVAVAAEHVTPGYWQQDELTAKAFVELGGKRFYKTGDRARYLPDGALAFVGRTDQQIKLHGHRIEPGDIETALVSHERCDRAVVALADDPQGSQRLVAWVVSPKRQTVSAAELRDYLKQRLPRYMLPSVIEVIDNLPLTVNGKVDRRALPEPKWGRRVDQKYIAPRTETEEQLAAIWADVLGLPKVGIDDDFFDLGGHSLLAMQLMSRTADSMMIGLPLRQLFDGPTIAQVAKAIDDVRWAVE